MSAVSTNLQERPVVSIKLVLVSRHSKLMIYIVIFLLSSKAGKCSAMIRSLSDESIFTRGCGDQPDW
jgi:hypothetical protein